MNEGWLPDVATMGVALVVWVLAVLAYGFWRSRGSAPTDPIRPSGPIFRS